MAADDMSTPAKLSGRHISIAYGEHRIIDDLDLLVPARRFTALLGPNGSGKSTLLRALAGLLAPTHGTILLDGKNIESLSAREMARTVGVLLQGPVAPEGMTARDLVRQGRYPHRSFFGRWTEDDQAACDEALMLTGTTTLADIPLDRLSGGQRQRAWIAMTLAQQGDILLLDEPTTYLDLAHQIELMKLVAVLVREHGKTVVAVLHDINQAARYAEHLVLLQDGRINAAGRPEEVISEDAIAEVFGVRSMIVRDPVAGTPLCVPL